MASSRPKGASGVVLSRSPEALSSFSSSIIAINRDPQAPCCLALESIPLDKGMHRRDEKVLKDLPTRISQMKQTWQTIAEKPRRSGAISIGSLLHRTLTMRGW